MIKVSAIDFWGGGRYNYLKEALFMDKLKLINHENVQTGLKQKKLNFVQITEDNLLEATKMQMKIFPSNECAYSHYARAIKLNQDYQNYYMVYDKEKLVGVTGLYSFEKFQDTNSIWLGWFGVDEKYRKQGYGSAILQQTMDLAKSYMKKYPDLKYFRLYTSSAENEAALPLYRKYMDIEEAYRNENDINYDNTILIFSKSLRDDLTVPQWDNRFMNLKQSALDELAGYKIFQQKIANAELSK